MIYETTIKYAPITKNVILSIAVEESFEHEEDGVKAILTPSEHAIIHTPKPKRFCNIKPIQYCTEIINKKCDKCCMKKEKQCIKNMREIDGWW